jgi:hypothetical protein
MVHLENNDQKTQTFVIRLGVLELLERFQILKDNR